MFRFAPIPTSSHSGGGRKRRPEGFSRLFLVCFREKNVYDAPVKPCRKVRHGGEFQTVHRAILSNGYGASTVIEGNTDETGETMAAKKKAKKGSGDLIISKSRTKAATKKCNVSSDFYSALDKVVRGMIASAEARALGNKRKTLKPVDL
jgi:hypothetical protein